MELSLSKFSLKRINIDNSGTEKLMNRKSLKPELMKLIFRSLTILIVLAIYWSCASIISKSNWPLTINTNPNGAKVEITNKQGLVVYAGNTPATMVLKSGAGYFAKNSYRVKLTMAGYGEKIIPVECSLNGWYIGNLLIGGFLGMLIVDPLTGAMYKLDIAYINETLTKTTVNFEPSLRIIDISRIPENLKEHLVSIK